MRTPFRMAPWLMAAQAAMIVREHWLDLTELERQTVKDVLTRTKGRPHLIAPHEREELLRIAGRLRPLTVARRVALGGRKR
mgnify:CR=1 FL=1